MFLNVTDYEFGARGDNTNDDTDAFDRAIKKIKASGKIGGGSNTIYVPTGEYRLTRPLELPESSTLLGEGISTWNRSYPEPGGSTLHGLHSGNCILNMQSAYVKIQNISLYGSNNPGQTPKTGILLHRKIPSSGGTPPSIDFIRVERVNVAGYFETVGICSLGAEQIVFDQVFSRPIGNAKCAFFTGGKDEYKDEKALGIDYGKDGTFSNGYGRILNCAFGVTHHEWKEEGPGSSSILRMTDAPNWTVRDSHLSGLASRSIEYMPPKDTGRNPAVRAFGSSR